MVSRYGALIRERTKLLATLLRTPDDELETFAASRNLTIDPTRLRMVRDVLDALGVALAPEDIKHSNEQIDRAWSLLCGQGSAPPNDKASSRPNERDVTTSDPRIDAPAKASKTLPSAESRAENPSGSKPLLTQPSPLSPRQVGEELQAEHAPLSEARTTFLEGPDFRRGVMLKSNTTPARPVSSSTSDFRKELMRGPGSTSDNDSQKAASPPQDTVQQNYPKESDPPSSEETLETTKTLAHEP